ncbi:SDR family oxidoreductase [Mycobacterium sp. SMC-4]|uniref:SDR family NAD(P)-dependent oxidoreductase n=1 Tax=Mycobacterium sp. SMC-4 TaxID=2857059 RepID=UPI0021B4B68C|nr:SDR family oxidoreductase [Mycobacterium sp. SMC-4]UXA18071.1 SDR family oxidoreductase [Mycobacterium sp. SMC-4]
MNLSGATVLVTGASNGIGAGTARRLAEQGARVVLVARDEAALETVAGEVRARGAAAMVHSADLTDAQQVAALGQQVAGSWGTPDVIVNCAGAGAFQFIEETEPAQFVTQMAAPYLAACYTTRVFIEAMLARGRGWVVNVNSPGSRVVWPGAIGYAGARWALRGFSEALRADLAGTGIGVTEAVIGKVDSSYWEKNPGSEERVPTISRLSAPLSPDQAGAVVVRGVQAQASEVMAPWSTRLLAMQARLTPRPLAALMIRTGARRGRGLSAQADGIAEISR